MVNLVIDVCALLTRFIFRPKVAINVQNMLLARILDVLEGSAELHRSRKKNLRLKRAASPSGCQRGKPELNDANQHGRILETGTMEEQPIIISADVPNTTENITSSAMQDEAMDHSQHLSIGINEVTKVLEGVCKENRLHISAQNADDGREIPSSDITRLVLVCQADVNPPTLIAHLPQLVASCNSLRQIPSPEEASTKTLLAPLPIGAEASISFALGFKRASVILIDVQVLQSIVLYLSHSSQFSRV